MATDRIREVLRAAMAPKGEPGSPEIAELLLDQRVARLLAALDAGGLEIVEKAK